MSTNPDNAFTERSGSESEGRGSGGFLSKVKSAADAYNQRAEEKQIEARAQARIAREFAEAHRFEPYDRTEELYAPPRQPVMPTMPTKNSKGKWTGFLDAADSYAQITGMFPGGRNLEAVSEAKNRKVMRENADANIGQLAEMQYARDMKAYEKAMDAWQKYTAGDPSWRDERAIQLAQMEVARIAADRAHNQPEGNFLTRKVAEAADWKREEAPVEVPTVEEVLAGWGYGNQAVTAPDGSVFRAGQVLELPADTQVNINDRDGKPMTESLPAGTSVSVVRIDPINKYVTVKVDREDDQGKYTRRVIVYPQSLPGTGDQPREETFSKPQVGTNPPAITPEAPSVQAPSKAAQLKELFELQQSGAITDAEYTALKEEVLGRGPASET